MKVFEIDLHDNEEIILKVRQHWVLLLWPITKFLVVAAVGGTVLYFFKDSLDGLIFILLMITWLLIAFDLAMHDFFRWYLNLYVVTNKRIINVTHRTIFKRQITEASLSNVQDVTHQTLGFISMLLNYGDVVVQTAGHQPLINFKTIGSPRRIHKEIVKLTSNHQNQKSHHKPSFLDEGI